MNGSAAISFLRKAAHLLVLRPIMKLVFGFNVVGRENLPAEDQCIIIANHNSHLDIILLFCLLPISRITTTHPVAERVYFSRSRIVFALVEFFFQPIWIERGRPDTEGDPFHEIKSLLDRNHTVIIFPEGTRGKPGVLEHFKSGIGRLIVQYPDLPIVPIFLSGPERSLPKASSLLLPFWNHVIIGPAQQCRGSHRDTTRLLEGILIGLSCSESVRRHKRRTGRHKSPRSIAFLGIDGSGKSTLSRTVAEVLSSDAEVSLISDQLTFFKSGTSQPMQPLGTETLRKTVSDYAKKAGSLKSYKIPKLAELLLRNHLYYEVRRWYNPDIIVMDGSPLLNMAAWAALYKEMPDDNALARAIGILSGRELKLSPRDPIFTQFPELTALRRLHLDRLIMPEIVIFLDVRPDTACNRITARGESRQVHETEEKLTQLREAYITVCGIARSHMQAEVSIIDGERPRNEVTAAALAFINQSIAEKDGTDESPH